MNRLRRIGIFLLTLLVLGGLMAYEVYGWRVQDRLNRGLDLQGGLNVVLQGEGTPDAPLTDEAMEQAKAVIENRVNSLGLTEPVIQRQGRDRLIVQLPGIKDPEAAIDIIGRTAVLEFRDPDGRVVVTGKDLKRAREEIQDPSGSIFQVSLEFTNEGAAKFAEATGRLVGQPLAIVLDGQILQTPIVQERIDGGQARITGYPTLEEAKRMRILLNSGSLPVKLNIIENRSVSATLGADSIARSVRAALIGIALVIAFMGLVYGWPGVVANVALLVYAALNLLVLALFKATITLPGVAGFVLGIGMAVDANVIIFERVREEARAGKSIRVAVDNGFRRAFATILDSNVTTLIAAATLFYLGTGPVKGFAVTLTVGILASMFTAITLTRFLMRLSLGAGLLSLRNFGVRQAPATKEAKA